MIYNTLDFKTARYTCSNLALSPYKMSTLFTMRDCLALTRASYFNNTYVQEFTRESTALFDGFSVSFTAPYFSTKD